MSWTVTAGVLCGTWGVSVATSIGLAAPAQAEPAAVDRASDPGDGPSGADRRGNLGGGPPRVRSQVPGIRPVDSNEKLRSPGRPIGRGSAGEDPGKNIHFDESPEWHCQINWPDWPDWSDWPDLPIRPAQLSRGGDAGDGNILQLAAPLPAPPLAQSPATTGRVLPGLGMEGLSSPGTPNGTAFPESPLVAPATSPSKSPRAASATGGLIEPTPLAGVIAPPAAPPSRPGPGARLPEAGRVGYPNYLREADIADVAALALPGVAGLLGITAFGGFLGYRQAKAGHALPAGGIARFLQ